MVAGCSSNPFRFFGPCGAPMQGFALKPMEKVRVACVGVGARGAGAVHRISMIPGTQVVAIADLFQDRVDRQVKWLADSGKPAPIKTFSGPDSYKRVCDMDEVDVVYSVTPWYLHVPGSVCAMEHGQAVHGRHHRPFQAAWRVHQHKARRAGRPQRQAGRAALV